MEESVEYVTAAVETAEKTIEAMNAGKWVSVAEQQLAKALLAVKEATKIVMTNPFICGSAGAVDSMGLPDFLFVCPHYGLDGFAVYKKHEGYTAPGW